MERQEEFLKVGEYGVGLSPRLDKSVGESAVELIERPGANAELRSQLLSGRSVVSRADLPGIGPVVVKCYSRGGVLRYFIGREHFRVGRSRPEHEYRMLTFVAGLSVRVPEPIAWITKGGLIYHGWLVTREIEGSNLAELTIRDVDRAGQLVGELVRQLNILIENRVCHVDLHPGNVVITSDDEVHLVDFDKAYFYSGSSSQLRDYYLRRWRRAVLKHGLPELLSELMCLHLRRVGDDRTGRV